jgi:hypothetical protein
MMNDTERMATISAISGGQLNQVGKLFDEIKDISDKLKSVQESGHAHVSPFSDAEPVTVPADDAKSVDVRDSVIEIAELLNSIIAKSKG